jgi:hypothetical protein
MMEGALRHLIFGLAMALVALPAAAFGTWSSSAPEADDVWRAHDPAGIVTVDHAAWGAFLTKYLDVRKGDANRVAYGAVTASDKAALEGYLATLAATPISRARRDEQFAYWLNLYNALTVKVILDHYPVASIRDIDISGLFANGPWGAEVISVEGRALSLDDIEHRILRPIWGDPRIHYGVNCASIGCPDLLPQPFTAANVGAMLDRAARDFVNSPRGVSVQGEAIRVSKIYSWFAHDFGDSEAGVLAHLKTYAEPGLAATLARVNALDGAFYDWSLNTR